MISNKMTKAINDQINAELYSAYLYMAMSSYCNVLGLKGASHWFFVQMQEEMTHAFRFYKYVADQGQHCVMEAIEKPQDTFKDLKDMFEKTLAHERIVTGRINKLVDLARKESDHATDFMLGWFVSEQVEEEATASEFLQMVTFAGKDMSGILMIDKDLGARVFTPPTDIVIG